jgi:hypothetical protein
MPWMSHMSDQHLDLALTLSAGIGLPEVQVYVFYHISLTFTLILSFHLCLHLPNGLTILQVYKPKCDTQFSFPPCLCHLSVI